MQIPFAGKWRFTQRVTRALLLGCAVSLLAVSLFAQPSVLPVPSETFDAYQIRMEAYFAPEIARVGLDALIADEGSEYNAYKRILRYWEPRLRPEWKFEDSLRRETYFYGGNPGRRRAVASGSLEERETVLAGGTAATWRELGPKEKPAVKSGAEGTGPIEFLTFYGPSPKYMLCGSVAGGLFYSIDGGATWSSTGTDTEIGLSGVETAVFHPGDYKTWFIGSGGNGGGNEPDPIGAGGVFRTTDEGVTWTQIAFPTQIGNEKTIIYKLAINPANADQLWLATSAGVFTTVNALSKNPAWSAIGDLKGLYAYDFEIRPGDPNWLYAAVADANRTNWRVVYSSDHGAKWQNLAPPVQNASALTIEVTPAKPDNLYVLIVFPSQHDSLYIYDFAKAAAALVTSAAYIQHGGGHAFGVDTFDRNVIYLSEGIGGRRYTHLGTPPFVKFDKSTYHDDIEDLVSHPLNPNEVWMCHHGGVSVSTDGGITWTDRSKGLGAALIWSMTSSVSDPRYVSLGLYHAGTIVTAVPNTGWQGFPNSFGDGLRPLIDPSNPDYMWFSYALQGGDAWYKSVDRGKSFNSNPPYSPGAWSTDAAFDWIDPRVQFRFATDAKGNASVRRTVDRFTTPGDSIVDLKAIYGSYSPIAVYTPETADNYLLIHLREPNWQHHFLRTKMANAAVSTVLSSWQECPLAENAWICDVDFDPANPDVVYTANTSNDLPPKAARGMIYKADYTNPAAPRFEDLTQNLPNASMGGRSLAVEYTNGGLYVATDFGCYYSNDATRATGNGWVRVGTGLPHTSYHGIEINRLNQTIRASSYGRGLWEHDLVATVAGIAFLDADGNGLQGPTEPPLSGWVITLADAFGGTMTTTTSVTGRYFFSGLRAGKYLITEGARSGWTIGPANGYSVQLPAATLSTGLDFANRITSSLTSCFPAPYGMVAWWALDEAAGPSAHDRAGYANTGTHVSAPAVIHGKVENALRFDGVSQYVSVPSHAELNAGTGDFSIEAWIRTTSNDVRTILDKRVTSARGDDVHGYSFVIAYGRLGVQLADRNGSGSCSSDTTSDSCTNWFVPAGSKSVADGHWHHVAVTVDRDNPNGGVLYVDGAAVYTFDPTIRNLSLDNAGALLIGRSVDGTSWNGDIDEVAIFKRALTPLEVLTIFKGGKNVTCYDNGCSPAGCV